MIDRISRVSHLDATLVRLDELFNLRHLSLPVPLQLARVRFRAVGVVDLTMNEIKTLNNQTKKIQPNKYGSIV